MCHLPVRGSGPLKARVRPEDLSTARGATSHGRLAGCHVNKSLSGSARGLRCDRAIRIEPCGDRDAVVERGKLPAELLGITSACLSGEIRREGRASDLLGRRRVFLAALTVFALASALGGAVNDGTLVIATRLIKGIAAAFTIPAGLSILTTTFAEGAARNKALGAYAATGAAGFSLGLVIGACSPNWGGATCFSFPPRSPLSSFSQRFGCSMSETSRRSGIGTTTCSVP
jgi:hypothetical protein